MRLEPRRSAHVALCIALAPLALASCQETRRFGMPENRFEALLAGEDPNPLLAIEDRDLDEPGPDGAAACYFLARWIDARTAGRDLTEIERVRAGLPPIDPTRADPVDRMIRLLRLSYEKGRGALRIEAGRALAARLAAASRWKELLEFCGAFKKEQGPDWLMERARLEALENLGMDRELSMSVAELRGRFPVEAEAEADALSFFEAAAAYRLGEDGWLEAFRRLLLDRPVSEWTGRTLSFLDLPEQPIREISEKERRAARMRVAVRDREYGLAFQAMAGALDIALSPFASPALVSDAGKAFLYSGGAREGLPRFAFLEETAYHVASEASDPAVADRAGRVAWTASFYRARLLRALERWSEAAAAFRRARDSAPSPSDLDAALWYQVDCEASAAARAPVSPRPGASAGAEMRARRALLDSLDAASRRWNDPSRFADLADGLFLDAIRARDWDIVVRLAGKPGWRFAPEFAARSAYVSGRAIELGLYPGPAGFRGGRDPDAPRAPRAEERIALASERYRLVIADPAAPLYYRALAAWRLHDESPLLPAWSASAPAKSPDGASEEIVAGLVRFHLVDAALEEAKARVAAFDRAAVRRLAALMVKAGRADASIRLSAAYDDRLEPGVGGADPETLYPRPFLSEVRSLRLEPEIPEPVVYGLIRSESYFRAEARSAAGAVGLMQLMPSTAREIARGLRLESYDLRAPADNLRIGAAFFSELLAESSGRALRAMMAYNAGRGRLKKWLAESGELPDDLMLESLGIKETREYGRKILQASAMYGELYYGVPARKIAGEIVEGLPGFAKAASP